MAKFDILNVCSDPLTKLVEYRAFNWDLGMTAGQNQVNRLLNKLAGRHKTTS